MKLALLFVLLSGFILGSRSQTLVTGPPAVGVSCLPQAPLPPSCASGNIYSGGYCSSSSFPQSPLNIDTTNPIKYKFSSPLTCKNFDKAADSATFVNRDGELIVYSAYVNSLDTPTVTGGPCGSTTYAYTGTRLKFGLEDDSGTEHALNGKKYALEAQLIFTSAAKGNIIICVMFFANETGLAIPQLTLNSVRVDGSAYTQKPFPLAQQSVFDPDGTPYAYYLGSDTKPPCSPNIAWIVSLRTLPITFETLQAYRKIQGPGGVPMAPNMRKLQGSTTSGVVVGLASKATSS